MTNEGNSVKQGVGIGIGLILLFTVLAMIPICGCGGCVMFGFIAGPGMEPARRAAEKMEQRRLEREGT